MLESLRANLEPSDRSVDRPELDSSSVNDELEQLDFVERNERALRVALPKSSLRPWLDDGRMQLLLSSVSRQTDNSHNLELLPAFETSDGTRWPGIDPTHCLRRFIASPANQPALTTAENLVREAGQYPSLLSLSGPSGSGKTHLLQGIALGLLERGGRDGVLCMDAESLSHALITSLRGGGLEDFRERLREQRAILIDDIEALAGREATQEELLGALDPVFGQRSLVVVTSERPIDQVEGLIPALRERLTGGGSVSLTNPPWEARVAIVIDRIAGWGIDCQPEAAALIANLLGDDLGRLDGQLTRVITHGSLAQGLHDLDAVRSALSDEDRGGAPLSPELVVDFVTRHFNLRVADLRSPSRSPRLTTPRQISMYLLRRHCGLSYPEIGQCFKRHHTTAMHACRRIDSLRERQSSLRATIGLLEKELLRHSDQTRDDDDFEY